MGRQVDRPKITTMDACHCAQWVFDSANWRVLMPAERYAPGQALPPHLSPFVNNEEEGYTPDFAQEIARLQVCARPSCMCSQASGKRRLPYALPFCQGLHPLSTPAIP